MLTTYIYIYIYGLFLYLSIDKKENFWALYNQIPEELHKNKWVVIYVIEVYLSHGNVTEARKHLTQLQKVYGETSDIRKLKEKIAAEDSGEGQTERPIVQSNMAVDRLSCIDLRRMLLMFKQKSSSFLAEVSFLILSQYFLASKKVTTHYIYPKIL